MSGVGIYWCIVEMLREENEYSMNIEDVPDIAYELQCDEKTVYDIVENFDLFVINENKFTSKSLIRRMEKLDDKREKMAAGGRKGAIAKAKLKDSSSQEQAPFKPPLNQVQASKGKESKEEYNKVNNNKELKEKFPAPELSEFLEYAKEICLSTGLNYESLKFTIETKYETWKSDNWHDGNKKKIKNWKNKFNSTLPYLKEIKNKENDANRYNAGKQDYSKTSFGSSD